GPGAGGYETASAVVSDMINSAGITAKAKNIPEEKGEPATELPDSAYYLRFNGSLPEAESYLASQDIQFEILSTEDAALRTLKMSAQTLQKIQNTLAPAAVYKINGAE